MRLKALPFSTLQDVANYMYETLLEISEGRPMSLEDAETIAEYCLLGVEDTIESHIRVSAASGAGGMGSAPEGSQYGGSH